MKRSFVSVVALLVISVLACKQEKGSEGIFFESPEIGSYAISGEDLTIKLNFSAASFDSVAYYVDSTRLGTKTDSSAVHVSTAGLSMGSRLLTAKVYNKGTVENITSNVILKPGKEPESLSYEVIKTFPHDTSSYTQGLEFHDGVFYESDGEYGGSSIRKVQPATGKAIQKEDIGQDVFAEGLTVVGDKIIQLTWQNKFGYVRDKASFKQIGQFPYQSSSEGWGLAFDGKRIYKSDGSNTLYFLNKDTYHEEGSVEVYSNEGPVDQLNELEYIDGKIYANVYQTDKIVIIDPKTGAVTAQIDLTDLYPNRNGGADVLNGIAVDKSSGRLFVTGKKWDKLFEIRLKK